MRMHPLVRPDSGRPFFITMSMIRLGAVLGCVALGVTALASASSSAEKLGQTVYARAVAMIIGGPASAGPSSETKAAPAKVNIGSGFPLSKPQ